MLTEKSESKSQQRFMGMVYAYKNGELDTKNMSKSMLEKIKKAADGMTKKEAKKLASTKHKDIPEKVNKEERILFNIRTLNEYVKKNARHVISEMFTKEMDYPYVKSFKDYHFIENEAAHKSKEIAFDGKYYGIFYKKELPSKKEQEDLLKRAGFDIKLSKYEDGYWTTKNKINESISIPYTPESLREDYDESESDYEAEFENYSGRNPFLDRKSDGTDKVEGSDHKAENDRVSRLMPNGIPRYIRCYDNGGETFDRYTVVYTGRYTHKTGGSFLYVGMSEKPFHPQGFGQHGESEHQPIDSNGGSHLGKKIAFKDLPPDCQKLVLDDYKDLWDINN